MDAKTDIARAFENVIADFNRSQAIVFLREGKLRLPHYKSILRQIFHYAREDPQIQALASAHLRGADRKLVRTFLKHATSEVGHDEMALSDLRACGDAADDVACENPLPATVALTAFAFYQIEHRNAIGYLGYLYFLEHMPTSQGNAYASALAMAGIPPNGMSFLSEHVAVDVAHNTLMERYIKDLVRTPADAEEVIYAMRVTSRLYANMLWDAICHSEAPTGYGINTEEAARA